MHSHVLTEADRWFIEKGQIDPLTRFPFDVGCEVVVCEHKHVMLAEFYDGKCFLCDSTVTVPFGHSAVEYPKPPKPKDELLKWFFPDKVARRVIPKLKVALVAAFAIVFIIVILLGVTHMLPNTFPPRGTKDLIASKTDRLLSRIGILRTQDNFAEMLASYDSAIFTRNVSVFESIIAVLSALGIEFWSILTALCDRFLIQFDGSKELLERIYERTYYLVGISVNWIIGS